MCLTAPVKIKKTKGIEAETTNGRKINTSIAGKVKVGDWVLANADLAIKKISAKEAKEIKGYLK